MKTNSLIFTMLVLWLYSSTVAFSVTAPDQAAKRQSYGNLFTQLVLNAGIPFVKGDIVAVPTGRLIGLQRQDSETKILYLVQINGQPDSKAFCIIAKRTLKTIDTGNGSIIYEPLKLRYKTTLQYNQGVETINSFAFEVVE